MRTTTARSLVVTTLLAILSLALPLSAAAAVDPGQVRMTRIVGGFSSPVGVTNAGDGTKRLFVVEQGGLVRVVKGSAISPTVFLDLTAKILPGSERGLLGLAFDPSFETNRHVFAFYTRAGDGALVVSRFIANSAGTQAASSSERILTTIAHPTYGNHNGGGLAFGPDGFLYLSSGDGGGQGVPNETALDLDRLLG
jgi:glucose/arabinose dehydrogenase